MYSGVVMNDIGPEFWECEHALEVNASPRAVWALFQDIRGWKRWNAGIESIDFEGPFQAGATFRMTPPGQPSLTSRLVEVTEEVGFVDETQVGDLKVYVEHRIDPLHEGRCRVVYSLSAFGPGCEEAGPQIASDFPQVLSALASMAAIEAACEKAMLCECSEA